MIHFAFLALVSSVNLIGGMAWYGLRDEADESAKVMVFTPFERHIQEAFCRTMLGFALVSVALFFLAHFGCFQTKAIWTVFALYTGFCGLIYWKRKVSLKTLMGGVRYDMMLVLTLTLLTACLSFVSKPQDAVLASMDASIYLGTAHQLAKTGQIKHHDPLAAEMSIEERRVLFENRFKRDQTGPYARFPGGVPLIDPAKDLATFYFYHLLPVWLGFGLKFLGAKGYLQLLSLFGSISLVSLFSIGGSLGGRTLGLSLCLITLFFYPQLYYCGFPSSEILSQCLFLSGFYIFVNMVFDIIPRNRIYKYTCGLLWGALCLCRVDCMLFIVVGLLFSFIFLEKFKKDVRQWAPLIICLVFFASIAAYHQLANGTYLKIVKAFLFNASLGSIVSSFIVEKDVLGVFFIAAATGMGIAFIHRCRSPMICKAVYRLLKILGLILALAFLAYFARRFDWSRVVRHLQWIALYIPFGLLGALVIGFMVSLADPLLNRGTSRMGLFLLFFGVPAFCYLIDPMVSLMQPWAIRRFVPMFFPLFFILCLYGWQVGLGRIFGSHFRLAGLTFAGLAVITAVVFLSSSAYLLGQPVQENVSEYVDELAKKVPQDALILIPDSNAGLHLQIPLQYAAGRDTLLLPLAGCPEQRFEEVVSGFLSRQIEKGRRVFVLFSNPADLAGWLVEHFGLSFSSATPFSFTFVAQVRHDQRPDHLERVSLKNLLFEIHNREQMLWPTGIRIGVVEEDVPFIIGDFYGPETSGEPQRPTGFYRWTGAEAKLLLPPVASVSLTIDSARPEQAEPAEFSILLDGVPLEVNLDPVPRQMTIHAPVEERLGNTGTKTVLTIRSNTFNPQTLGLSSDTRNLGLRLLRIDMVPSAFLGAAIPGH